MAVTTVQTNNKLVKYTQEINREWVRGNAFSPYQSAALNAIIRIRSELKSGGEQMNIPLVARLTGQGKGSGTLVGNEDKIDNYGMRVWLDWARNAVVTNKADQQKDSADIFGEAKPLLSDWLNELKRDELIAALMALPSESSPVGLGSDVGDRVNGLRYEDATAAQRNTWAITDNSDRIVYGAATTNTKSTHALSLAELDVTNDKCTATNLSLLKRIAKNANPKIRPYKVEDGREYFVAFAGTNTFRDLKISLETINKDARPRENEGVSKNPLFQDGDQIYDGVIIREVPEISAFVTNVWTTLKTAGTTSNRCEPVFLCGQQAAVMAIGQMARPTFRKEDDYQFITGTGIEAAYGISKIFKKPQAGTKLVQWGVATGFYASAAD
jgi:hypothetical protein